MYSIVYENKNSNLNFLFKLSINKIISSNKSNDKYHTKKMY